MPVTKHNYMVKDINELAKTIRQAFYIAKSGRPGPVLIDIPKTSHGKQRTMNIKSQLNTNIRR